LPSTENAMPHEENKLTPANPRDLAEAVAFALRCFEGRKRTRDADAFRAALAAETRCAPSGPGRLRRDEPSRRHTAQGRIVKDRRAQRLLESCLKASSQPPDRYRKDPRQVLPRSGRPPFTPGVGRLDRRGLADASRGRSVDCLSRSAPEREVRTLAASTSDPSCRMMDAGRKMRSAV
jgi:hypothetical protein